LSSLNAKVTEDLERLIFNLQGNIILYQEQFDNYNQTSKSIIQGYNEITNEWNLIKQELTTETNSTYALIVTNKFHDIIGNLSSLIINWIEIEGYLVQKTNLQSVQLMAVLTDFSSQINDTDLKVQSIFSSLLNMSNSPEIQNSLMNAFHLFNSTIIPSFHEIIGLVHELVKIRLRFEEIKLSLTSSFNSMNTTLNFVETRLIEESLTLLKLAQNEETKLMNYLLRAIILSISIIIGFILIIFSPLLRINYEEAFKARNLLNQAKVDLPNLSQDLQSFRFIGEKYKQKADKLFGLDNIDRALENYRKSLEIFHEINDNNAMGEINRKIGFVYQFKQNTIESLNYFRESYINFEKSNNIPEMIQSLFLSIITNLSMGEIGEAKELYPKLTELNLEIVDITTNSQKMIANALILKNLDRSENKVKATKILREVSEIEDLDDELIALSLIHLCDLLILELQAYGSDAVIEELTIHINELYQTAQKLNSLSLLVDVLILKSKISLLLEDVERANLYMQQAFLMANESKSPVLIEKVKQEEIRFLSQFKKWEDLLQKGSSLKDRINVLELNEYLSSVARYIRGVQR
jgi:tetratricopeptide (TPR) repeat protein